MRPQLLTLPEAGQLPVEVTVKERGGSVLASFTTPLPIRKTPPPELSMLMQKSDEQLTLEEKYLKGRKYDRATDRLQARKYYEMALAEDPGHVPALRALAVLDLEAGLYQTAADRLRTALKRDSDDGLSWFFLGICHLRLNELQETLRCGYRAARCFGTTSLGYDLVGRASMRLKQPAKAVEAFTKAVWSNPTDGRAKNHLALALYAAGKTDAALRQAKRRLARRPTDLTARALLAMQDKDAMDRFAKQSRAFVGEDDFEMLETSLVFAELGLAEEAARLVSAACVEAVSPTQLSPLPLYYVAYYNSLRGDEAHAGEALQRAAGIDKDLVFASRPEAVEVLKYAVTKNPADARAYLQLGNLYANLGRMDEAADHWAKAAELNPALSIAFRNLGVYAAAVEGSLPKAEGFYRKAIAARPADQTLYRDLAEILIAEGKRPAAIELLATMPYEGMRRAEIIVMLARAYLDEQRYTETIDLLESTPYFVNWEGQNITRVLFVKAHMQRGQQRFAKQDFKAGLKDFEAALTYPENLGVGRSNRPEESPAQYWRGKALRALGRLEAARAAWKAGAALPAGSDEQNRHRQLCREAAESSP